MSCNCCDKPLRLGCLPACGGIELDVSPTLAGDKFQLSFAFAGAMQSLTANIINDGDKPFFNLKGLNENYTFSAQLLKNGTVQTLTDADNNQYNCIEWRTKIADNNYTLTTKNFALS